MYYRDDCTETQRRLTANGYMFRRNRLICPRGHESSYSFNTVKAREWRAWKTGDYSDVCPSCKVENYHREIEQELGELGYSLLNPLPSDFKPRTGEVDVICQNGHKARRVLENLRAGPSCGQCRLSASGWFETTRSLGVPLIEKTGINKARLVTPGGMVVEMSVAQIAQSFSLDHFTMFGFEKGGLVDNRGREDRNRYLSTCSKGHQFEISRRSLLEGHGCRMCSLGQINEPETTIGRWLEDAGLGIVRRDSSQGFEMDVYVPSRRVGIEYAGIRWHSVESFTMRYRKHPRFAEKLVDFKQKHQAKMLEAADKGVHLITVFESDYLHDRENLRYRILNIMSGAEDPSLDLRFRRLTEGANFGPPQPRFFSRSYREVEEGEGYKYQVYDCGNLIA